MSNWPALYLHPPAPQATALAAELGVNPFLAQLLCNRGIEAPEARMMLASEPPLKLPTPSFSADLQALFCANQRSPVAIFGDYDADGLSGTAVLNAFLSGAGFQITPLLPTRSQGYGLNSASIQALAEQGHRLLITVDCGISNAAEIAEARQLGFKVVITDHHGLPSVLPEADFILHPGVLKLPELNNLSGAGMAWWLTTLLAPVFPDAPSPESLLDLAVLGTLADMTPLRGLNFALAKRGLQAMSQTQRPGLIALATLKKVTLADLSEDDLTFRMIPLLNAAGRIGSPQPALELLLAQNKDEAMQLSETLQSLNQERQRLCEEVLQNALQILELNPPQEAIVLAESAWPHGVLGIICSQLVERYQLPVALLAIEGAIAKASVRAPKGYQVLQALQACSDLLLRFGGHEMAGGFSIDATQLDAFKTRFENACAQQCQGNPPALALEMVLDPAELELEDYENLRQLAPFGMGNPAPRFLARNVLLHEVKPDRKQERHFFAKLPHADVKAWGKWSSDFSPNQYPAQRFDFIYTLQRNTWKQQNKLELNIQYLRQHPSLMEAKPDLSLKKIENLPGFFWDGHNWWQCPLQPQEITLWHDHRHLSARITPQDSQQVFYQFEQPPEVQIRQAQALQFSQLYLALPPPSDSPIWEAFTDIYIGPLAPIPTPPDFGQLSQIMELITQGHTGLQVLSEKTQRSPTQISLELKCLSELSLLASGAEQYKIQYKNQLYDLRLSSTYQQQQQLWRYRHALSSDWQAASLERLKNRLLRKNEPC